jgi:exoribonuclease-2
VPFSTQDPPQADIKQAKALSEMFALRRTMKPSQHKRAPGPHAGLGLPYYTQATSPLRRYLDMIVHQQLRAYLRGDIVLDEKAILARIGATGAVAGSVRWAERRSIEHWTLVYLLKQSDWRGQGIIVDKRGPYDQVLIPELGLETQVYRRRKLSLDSTVTLALNEVKLADLEVHFQFLE